MLSLMTLLFYKQQTVAEEVSQILSGAIQHINMDEEFKEHYIFSAFLHLDKIEPLWQIQVRDLHKLWPKLVDVIDQDEFASIFRVCCETEELPVEDYDLDSAFHKAQNEF